MLLLYAFHALAHDPNQTVNRIIGDISFVKRFHKTPDEHTNEQLRIVTHLEYVESLLQEKDVSSLAAEQRRNRTIVLKLLKEYIAKRRFPVNEKYPFERRSCFIDRHGNICAVGYLIEKTVKRSVAEKINGKYQYEYITDMNDPVIARWANAFGLTIEECAMIQPTYGPAPDPYISDIRHHPINASQGVASSIIGGVNAALLMTNLSGSSRGMGNTFARAGIFTGVAQIIFGAATLKKDHIHSTYWSAYRDSYKARNTLSYVNIATGAATVMTSVVNMAINRKAKRRKNTLNLYSSPGMNKNLDVGFAFVKRIG